MNSTKEFPYAMPKAYAACWLGSVSSAKADIELHYFPQSVDVD